MAGQTLISIRRHPWMIVTIAFGCVGIFALVIAWPRLVRTYAANRLAWAVTADEEESDPLGSRLIFPAAERAAQLNAQDEAVAALVPLLNPKNDRVWLRAIVALLELKRLSPEATTVLRAVYRDDGAFTMRRLDAAYVLNQVVPHIAEECGAAETCRRLARNPDLMGGGGQAALFDSNAIPVQQ
jgi:hypothetical protein